MSEALNAPAVCLQTVFVGCSRAGGPHFWRYIASQSAPNCLALVSYLQSQPSWDGVKLLQPNSWSWYRQDNKSRMRNYVELGKRWHCLSSRQDWQAEIVYSGEWLGYLSNYSHCWSWGVVVSWKQEGLCELSSCGCCTLRSVIINGCVIMSFCASHEGCRNNCSHFQQLEELSDPKNGEKNRFHSTELPVQHKFVPSFLLL